ncbi:uncharacterized protein LOC120455945 [Drosophila santomea]|uniref:uncharacterized protein LOC120455945 n=1 Tax=Drosophila santomea TaxID=129105 RepID=UPI0019532AC0|nr:uncharacterized protein LOC120455945 [Drosophila santomea]XP_039498416.1 uncharacterized protein LOC120455945 [Drosophila santomea]
MFAAKQGSLAARGVRYFRLGWHHSAFGRTKGCDKTSATVLASHLPKDQQTELLPEEPRKPEELMQHLGPRRNEQEQRRIRKAQYESHLKELLQHKSVDAEMAIQCVPFVKMPCGSENPLKRRYDSAESLLEQVSDPKELAKEVIKLATELRMERQKNEIVMQSFLDLEELLFLKNSASSSENSATKQASQNQYNTFKPFRKD